MRRSGFGEGSLAANMVIMDLDGIPLYLVVLMGKVCGDTFTKDGAEFVIVFLLRLVLVPRSCFGMIFSVNMVLCVISSLLFMCLL